MVPQNMPGAGSLKLANYLYNVAPKDGTALGTITQSTPQEEALGTQGISYRSTQFNWIGRITSNVEINVVWHTSGIKTIADAKKKETVLAGTGPTTPSEVFPRVLNKVVGTKFKVVGGYGGSSEGVLAMERGETMGALLSWASLKATKQDWLTDKKVAILVQYAVQKHPDMPGVPTMVELGETEDARKILAFYASGAEIGRSIMAPPGIPVERVHALRAAFDAMVQDPKFLSEIKKANLEFDPLSGENLQKIVEDARNIPSDLVERAKAVRDAR
jgi:tripartite-type tricarboxylate transporter receptor subunit TctC